MDTGRLRLGVVMLGSWARTTHSGRTGDGFADTEHQIDAGWAEWNFDAQIALHPRFAFDVVAPVRLTLVNPSVKGPDGTALPVDDTIHRKQRVFGFGDLLLATRWGVLRNEDARGWVADIQLGATLPTGRARPNAFGDDSSTGVEQVSLGSGTIVPFYGASVTYNAGRWGVTSWASARVPVARNKFGNRGSRVLSASAGAFSGFGLIKWRFIAAPEVFVATPARWQDNEAPNSQRLAVMARVGAFYQPRPKLNLSAALKVPVVSRTPGGNLLWPIVALVGINYTFELIPEKDHHHG